MIGRSGERWSGISMMTARHDDDDDDIYIYIYIYMCKLIMKFAVIFKQNRSVLMIERMKINVDIYKK